MKNMSRHLLDADKARAREKAWAETDGNAHSRLDRIAALKLAGLCQVYWSSETGTHVIACPVCKIGPKPHPEIAYLLDKAEEHNRNKHPEEGA